MTFLIESAHLGAPGSSQSLTYENAADAIDTSWQDLHGKLGGSDTPANFWNQARRQGGVFQDGKPGDVKLNASALKAGPSSERAGRGRD